MLGFTDHSTRTTTLLCNQQERLFLETKSLQAVVSHFRKMAEATRGVFRLLLSTAWGIPGWGNWTFGLIGGFEPSGNKVSGIGWKPGAFQLQGVVTPWLP